MKVKKILSLIIITAVFSSFLLNIFRNIKLIEVFPWKIELGNIVLLFLSLLAVYPITSFSWHLLTKMMGFNVPLFENMRIWMFSNLGRFLPGGVWQYPGRVLLMSEKGIAKAKTVNALVLEGVLNLLVGLIVVTTSLFFWKTPLKQNLTYLPLLILALGLVLFGFTNRYLLNAFMTLINRLIGKKLELTALPISKLLPILMVFLLQYFFSGSALFFLAKTAIELPLSQLPIFVAIFTFSWLAGYLAFFAPGGLGVQEASIAGLLSFYLPLPIASLIAISFRICFYLVELITILLLWLERVLISSKKSI